MPVTSPVTSLAPSTTSISKVVDIFDVTDIMIITIFTIFGIIVICEFIYSVCKGYAGTGRLVMFVTSLVSLSLIGAISYFTYEGQKMGSSSDNSVSLAAGLSLIGTCIDAVFIRPTRLL